MEKEIEWTLIIESEKGETKYVPVALNDKVTLAKSIVERREIYPIEVARSTE